LTFPSHLLGHVNPCAPGSQALQSHVLYHKNSNGLCKQFHLTRDQA
jgi:hypothetical protein